MKTIATDGLFSISLLSSGIRLRTRVSEGLKSLLGREVETTLTDTDIPFVLSTLSQHEKYRAAFRVILAEHERRAAIVADPATGAVEYLANKPDSVQTSSTISGLVRETLRNF